MTVSADVNGDQVKKHLLLAPLGLSPGVILGLLDALNRRPDRVDSSIPPVTELWVVTTKHQNILKALHDEFGLLDALGGADYQRIANRILRVPVDDIIDPETHRTMSEVLYRLVLAGEAWRNEDSPRRIFSVAVSGGRKTMSAVLEKAATLFTVDHVFHLVYAGEETKIPNSDPEIQKKRDQLHLVQISEGPSAWRPWVDKLWNTLDPKDLLDTRTFPPATAWGNWPQSDRPEPQEIEIPGWNEPKRVSLSDRLEKVAAKAEHFADRSLACGISYNFLHHDLKKNLIDRLIDTYPESRELPAISRYLEGLSRIAKVDGDPGNECPVRLLPDLIDDALIIARGLVVESTTAAPANDIRWREEPYGIHIDLQGYVANQDHAFVGIGPELLVVALRNLLANVAHHAAPGPDQFRTAQITLEWIDGPRARIKLSVRNPISPGGVNRLREKDLVDAREEMPALFTPGITTGSAGKDDGRHEGLGLFTLHRIEQLTQTDDGSRKTKAVEVCNPRLEPAAANLQRRDFVIDLLIRAR